MPTPKKGPRLGGSPAHQKLILANLVTSLFEHGRITTTEAKARVLRPVAEKLITKAKKGDLHNRRQILATIRDKGVVHNLFEEIAPRYAERPGGYTRITKIGPRKGDNAPMAVIELVSEAYTPKPPRTKSSATPSTPAAPSTPVTSAAPAPADQQDQGKDAQASEEATSEGAATEASEGGSGAHADAHGPLEDESEAPQGYPVKGNESSMKYHEPDSQWYDQTIAEVWFKSAEAAEAAGFVKAGE